MLHHIYYINDIESHYLHTSPSRAVILARTLLLRAIRKREISWLSVPHAVATATTIVAAETTASTKSLRTLKSLITLKTSTPITATTAAIRLVLDTAGDVDSRT